MTSITVEHISKHFRLDDQQIVQAVDDVSFKVGEGGSVAIIGPSGCGKTTLLRMIAGLEMPDAGRVLYDDEPMEMVAKEDRGIGMVFQNYALMPQWDSEGNIGFFLRLRRREHEVPERVKQISRITGFGIEQLLGRFPRELSGGEKQRVAIARAFARDLKILLFDEPFANLDAKLRQQARVEARRLLTQYPVTTIYVTHDQQEASVMADRLILMRDGQVIQVGPYQSLYDAPATTFVAEFIGVPTINLFEGTIRDNRWYGLEFGGFAAPFPELDSLPVIMGIRPEHIVIGGEIEAHVMQATHYYAERFVLLEVSTGQAQWEVRVPEDKMTFQPGDAISVSFPPEKRYYFNGRTGVRLD